jgi:glycerophosphoryl diester phosphodiesterase
MVVSESPDGTLKPTALVDNAHAAGLKVHAWTFRAENMFLPVRLRRGTSLSAHGDLAAEIEVHVKAGIDGLFCDHPDIAKAALRRMRF